MMLWALKSQVKLTESQVDDDLVGTEVLGDRALSAWEECDGSALQKAVSTAMTVQ